MKFRSLHPFFYNPALGVVDRLLINRSRLVIENDVWIGQNAIILPSVSRIENGAVIGAGSVVSVNVPAFAIVAGNPAKLIRYRFSPQIIREIVESSWWEKDIDELRKDDSGFAAFLKPLD
jgi:virginiamycin A acetyltransferase